jgi:ADP-glucose pyrophosphorylase
VVAGRDISVAEDAEVECTILWNNVSVGTGSSLQNVIVVDGVELPKNTSVENAIVTPFRTDFQDQIAEFSATIIEGNIIWPLTSD